MKKIILVLVILSLVAVFGCSANENNLGTTDTGNKKPTSSIGAELLAEDASLLVGETTKLTLKAFIKDFVLASNPDYKGYNVTMLFKLPDNLEYVSGDLSWQGDIGGKEVKEIEIIVRAKDIGYVKASGSAISYQGTSYWGGGGDFKKICIVNSLEESCAKEIIDETPEGEVTESENIN